MIDTVATLKELERLANRLDKSGDAIAANRLRKLNAAVGGDPSFEDWAATDIQKVINPEAIVEGIKSRAVPGRVVSLCEWARNGLVLLPLILTWLGIWQASAKYGALIADNNQLNLPFLYLWQQGFNHTLAPPLILSNLATLDCFLLVIILLLTVFVTWRYSVIHAQTEKDAEQLRESLAHALGDATLCLTMMRRQQQQRQPNDLAGVARLLYQFATQFQTTSQQFLNELQEERKRRGDLNAFAASLDAMVKEMVSASNAMRQTSTELTTAVKEVLAPVKEIPNLVVAANQATARIGQMVNTLAQLVTEQRAWRQELQDVLAAGLKQLTADQRQAAHDLHTMLDAALRQLYASMGQQVAEQKTAAQELRTLLNALLTQLVAEQKRAGQELHTLLSTSLGQLVTEQRLLGNKLLDAADMLETTGTALGQVVQGLQDSVKAQAQMLAAMQGQQVAQRDLTDQMAMATAEIKQVLKSVRDASPELRSMSVDIDKFVRSLRDVPNTLKAELLDPLKYYSSAAAKIDVGSATLEKAAQYLESAANKLDGRLGP